MINVSKEQKLLLTTPVCCENFDNGGKLIIQVKKMYISKKDEVSLPLNINPTRRNTCLKKFIASNCKLD